MRAKSWSVARPSTALTHCHNRTSILTALQNELDGESRNETAVVFVDLDKFKDVNDTLGHAAGDEALVGVVERLKSATRGEDRVGRLGGDEFLLLIRGLPEPEVAMGVAQRICDSLRTPLRLSCGEVELRASIGVAFAGDEPISADELVKRADEAMYRSKERARRPARCSPASRHPGSALISPQAALPGSRGRSPRIRRQ